MNRLGIPDSQSFPLCLMYPDVRFGVDRKSDIWLLPQKKWPCQRHQLPKQFVLCSPACWAEVPENWRNSRVLQERIARLLCESSPLFWRPDLTPWNHWRMPVVVKEVSDELLGGPVLVDFRIARHLEAGSGCHDRGGDPEHANSNSLTLSA
jgi:hypothetical protein